jgi:hypothetical protein
MKKILGYVVGIAILGIPLISLAAEFRTGEQPAITKDEQVADDIYMVGGSVTSAGTVAGDVVAGGGNVVISGPVSGDVLTGGGNVTILSNVADDVRVGGGNIVIEGRVGGDVIAGGGQVTIGGEGVLGDVALGGGTIRIDAPIGGDMRVGGGKIYINAPITGNIKIEADELTLGSKAVINGNLTYKTTKELTKEEGAVINGKVTFQPRVEHTVSQASLIAIFSFWIIGKFLALLVCSLIIGLSFKRFSKEVVVKALEKPLMEIGRGLIVLAALPVLSVLAFVTVVGIPFGILGLLGFIALLLFSWLITPIIIGSAIQHYFSKSGWQVSWKTILLGTFVSAVVAIIPFIGWLLQTLIMLIALGVVVSVKWGVVKEWRKI